MSSSCLYEKELRKSTWPRNHWPAAIMREASWIHKLFYWSPRQMTTIFTRTDGSTISTIVMLCMYCSNAVVHRWLLHPVCINSPCVSAIVLYIIAHPHVEHVILFMKLYNTMSETSSNKYSSLIPDPLYSCDLGHPTSLEQGAPVPNSMATQDNHPETILYHGCPIYQICSLQGH